MTPSQLPQHPAPRVALYCVECGNQYSACRGDYFLTPPDQEMTCCEEPLILIQRATQLQVIEPWEAESHV